MLHRCSDGASAVHALDLEIVLIGARVLEPFRELPVTLAEGKLELNDQCFQNAIAYPLDMIADVRLRLLDCQGRSIHFEASGIRLLAKSGESFLEWFPDDDSEPSSQGSA